MTAGAQTSINRTARLAGGLHLSLLPFGFFSFVYVPSVLLVRGAAAATARNIMASEGLFRGGIISHLISQVIVVFLVLALYRLLEPVNKDRAVVMAVLALLGIPISVAAEVNRLTRNLWHSCGRATLDEWKERMGPRARTLYDRFEEMIASCGEYHVAPAKSRIAFLARVRFAGIGSLSEKGMTCTFTLPHPLQSQRFAKVYEVAPGWWAHRLRITDPAELGDEVQGWLADSYRLMGMPERLHRR
jgi:hypothetical protein